MLNNLQMLISGESTANTCPRATASFWKLVQNCQGDTSMINTALDYVYRHRPELGRAIAWDVVWLTILAATLHQARN